MSKMWKPNEVGVEVATRTLHFKPRRGRGRKVIVRIGQPVRVPKAVSHDPWWCPVQIDGLGSSKVIAAAGEDSVQALVLSLRLVESTLFSRAKRAGGIVDWLGENERSIFSDTFFSQAYEAAIANLVEGLKLAQELIERPGSSLRYQELTERLSQLTERRGFGKRLKRSGRKPKGAG